MNSNNLLKIIEIYIYNLNYKDINIIRLVNKEISELINKNNINSTTIKSKILKGYDHRKIYFYIRYEIDLLVKLVLYRPIYISNILIDIISNLLQNKNFDKNLLKKINSFIYNDLYYEVIEIINRLKENITQIKEKIYNLKNRKALTFYDSITDSYNNSTIKKLEKEMNIINKIVVDYQ